MRKKGFIRLWIIAAVLVLGKGAAAEAATISGSANFSGSAPAAEALRMDADPSCALIHPDGVASDSVLVNANGTLQNVFVYVKEGLAAAPSKAPSEPVVLDQVGCLYQPKVFGIQTGQTLEIRNSDNTLHNVHALGKVNKEFNLGMPIKGMKFKKEFSEPEVMVKIKCDVHPWMGAYAGVLSHPYFAVTDKNGAFQIGNLPPGDYVVEAWHEKFGTQTAKVSIAAEGDTQEAAFTFSA